MVSKLIDSYLLPCMQINTSIKVMGASLTKTYSKDLQSLIFYVKKKTSSLPDLQEWAKAISPSIPDQMQNNLQYHFKPTLKTQTLYSRRHLSKGTSKHRCTYSRWLWGTSF